MNHIFFLSFLLGCSRSHCTKSIHLALNNTKNDVKHIDTTKSLMIGQCSSTGEAIKVPPIVSFGAMITLFKITVQSARFIIGAKSTVFCWWTRLLLTSRVCVRRGRRITIQLTERCPFFPNSYHLAPLCRWMRRGMVMQHLWRSFSFFSRNRHQSR